jgi:hypothetical protein
MGLDGDWLWRFHRHAVRGQRIGTGLGGFGSRMGAVSWAGTRNSSADTAGVNRLAGKAMPSD